MFRWILIAASVCSIYSVYAYEGVIGTSPFTRDVPWAGETPGTWAYYNESSMIARQEHSGGSWLRTLHALDDKTYDIETRTSGGLWEIVRQKREKPSSTDAKSTTETLTIGEIAILCTVKEIHQPYQNYTIWMSDKVPGNVVKIAGTYASGNHGHPDAGSCTEFAGSLTSLSED